MRHGLVPPRAGSSNFGDSLEAVTLGAASGAARRSPRRGVGRARRAGRAGAGTAEGQGGCEACLPPFVRRSASDRGEGPAGGREGVRKSGRTRVTRPAGRGEAGGGAGHTWPRSRATCCVPPRPRGVVGGWKAPASFADGERGPLCRSLSG